jgi:LuxR family maltose regulon positive regulatory protein
MTPTTAAAPAALPPTLLATKLFVPPARADLLPRPRLYDRLARGLRGKLTVIAAPAGFGKTTLLSAWRAAGPDAPPFAWVSLDPADNDPPRFWSYVLAALDRVAPGLGAPGLALLQSPQPPPIDAILTGVLNALSAADNEQGDVALVLEDYHAIATPVIHETLARLLDYLPPRLHLVILTRAEPLPLARLRAAGAITELHADELRFTPDEVATLLNRVMGLALTPDELAALAARTEGWVAGLQLAALALRDQADRPGFIRAFGGSNRYIVDYLAAEVLARQPAPVQDFLLRTAILDRLCGPLCDAVLGRPAGGEGHAAGTEHPAVAVPMPAPASSEAASSQGMLLALERANLFVVPLDAERRWYRYHHLFAEVLRQRLAHEASGAAVTALHGRASAWYEGQGLVGEAVGHALAAAEWPRAARLLERYVLPAIVGGQVRTALGWLGRLPEATLFAHPRLCIYHALALLFANDLAAAESRLGDAERRIGPDTPPADADAARGYAAAIRANLALYTGDLAGCVAWGERVLALLPETEVIARTTARLHVARAFRITGEVTAAAERRAVAAVGPIRASGSVLGTVGALANVARLHRLQGRLRAAAATYDELAASAGGADALRGLHGGLAYFVGLGELHRERDELDAADGYLAQAMALLPGTRTVDAEDVALGYLALARLQCARGEHAAARATLDRLADEARRRGFVPHLVARAAAERARLALAAGDTDAAGAWARASGLAAEDAPDFPREAAYLVLARVWIARAERRNAAFLLPQAHRLLERLLDDAAAKGRQGNALEILLVRALAHWAQGARGEALETIARALALAEPEGYVRRFADEGVAMEALLRAARDRGIAPGYVARLLGAFPGGRDAAGPGIGASAARALGSAPGIPSDAPGFEPLSARELDVLRLLAGGRSNAEIARASAIAVSTVKTHVNRIFAKLQVADRAEAIRRARELHLL